MDNVIHLSNNWGQDSHSVSPSISHKPGREYSKEFYTGRLRPEVLPLSLSHTVSDRKGTPFVYLLLTNDTPFTYLVQTFSSLLTAKNTAFQI